MKWILMLIFFPAYATAQNNYSVIYDFDANEAGFTLNREKVYFPKIREHLIFNDSLTFSYYYFIEKKDPYKNVKKFGDIVLDQSGYCDIRSKTIYRSVVYRDNKDNFFMTDTVKSKDWHFFSDTINILGYKCLSALAVSDKNDSLLVWYNTAIKTPAGPVNYAGVPGLVMEVFDQARKKHLIATKIEKTDIEIFIPSNVKLVSLNDEVIH